MYANTAAAQSVVDRMQAYGVQASGEVVTAEYHQGVDHEHSFSLAEVYEARGRITRVRLLKEGRYCDISYIHATLPGGKIVPVNLSYMPSGSNCLNFYRIKGDFIAWGKEEGVYAKGLGLLDESNWAVLG